MRMLVVGSLIVVASPVVAASESLQLSGRVGMRFRVEDQRRGESDPSVKVKVKTTQRRDYRAVISAAADPDSALITVRDAYVRHQLDAATRVDAGLMKKQLGREMKQSRRHRLSSRRSLIYRQLESFAYIGRFPQLQWRDNDENATWSVAVGNSDALDTYVTGHASLDHHGWFGAGVDVLLQADRIMGGFQPAWVVMPGIWGQHQTIGYELELVSGLHPDLSEFSRVYGDSSPKHFAGVKLALALKPISNLDFWLQGRLSFLHESLDQSGPQTIEGTLSLVHRLDKRVRFGLDLQRVVRRPTSTSDFRTIENTAMVEFLYFFKE